MCNEVPDVPRLDVTQNVPGVAPRRGFLRTLCAGLAFVLTFKARRAHAKKVGLALGKVAELQQVGGARVLNIKDQKILIVRDSETSVRAINPTCTHKKCEVKYKQNTNTLFCKCHKSAFQLDGTVTAGPAPRPLQTYPAEIQNEQIVITLPDA